jgi:hypothetical protein
MHFENLSEKDLLLINSFNGPAYNKNNSFDVLMNIEEQNDRPAHLEPKTIYGFDPWEEIGFIDGRKVRIKIENKTGWVWPA